MFLFFALLYPEVILVVICALALIGWYIGDILQLLLMLTLVAFAPIIVISLVGWIAKKSVIKIRDVFHIEGKRLKHLCVASHFVSIATAVVLTALEPAMIILIWIPTIIYGVCCLVFWCQIEYGRIMYAGLIYTLLLLVCMWLCLELFGGLAPLL